MPNPNAVVSTAIRLEPPLDRPPSELLRDERGISVELDDGRRARLDPADPRSPGLAQVLDGLSNAGRPVYVELDPATSAITRLLIPLVVRVAGIDAVEEGALRIELEPSHARHVLSRKAPDFEELAQQLREALRTGTPVLVTEDDGHEIVDVRAYAPGPEGPPLPPFPEPELPRRKPRLPWWIERLWRWRWWPWWWWRWFHGCISPARAQQVFNALSATSCAPLTVPPPCIPFLYPDNGCWARAHEMCRLMINMGLTPRKVWIEGNLLAATRNTQSCQVQWGWHVAPWVCVRGPGILQRRDIVMDPSLFTTPVTKAAWKGVQGDPNATLTDSDAAIYYLWWNSTDPTYTSTNADLAAHRLLLQNRSVQHGPPPYAHCP